jgi:hypothetical protein
MANEYKTFRGYMKAISQAENKEDAIQNIFYGQYGADMAYQHDKITYNDLELIQKIIEKMA